MRVLVTRPEPDGARTAAKLSARGCEVMLAPLLRIAALKPELGGAWDALALTSINAVRVLADRSECKALLAMPAYTVGGRTADAARALGMTNVVSANGDVAALARLMMAQLRPGARVLYLAGEDHSGDLAGDLAAAGIAVETRTAYSAVAAAQFPQAAIDALTARGLDAVLHFSQRTAAIYLSCAAAAGLADQALAPAQYCLSQQVAEPLVAAGARAVRVAERPTEAALIELIKV